MLKGWFMVGALGAATLDHEQPSPLPWVPSTLPFSGGRLHPAFGFNSKIFLFFSNQFWTIELPFVGGERQTSRLGSGAVSPDVTQPGGTGTAPLQGPGLGTASSPTTQTMLVPPPLLHPGPGAGALPPRSAPRSPPAADPRSIIRFQGLEKTLRCKTCKKLFY